MYAVVGCDECEALWIVEGRPETSGCPRCGRTRAHEKRRQFISTDDEDHAREVRASMLAARQGHGDAFAELDSFAELETQLESAGIDDETYLSASGLDPERVAAAGTDDTTTPSRRAVVREAIATLEAPTEDAVCAYAAERDVSASYTERALTKLVRAGEATKTQGVYELVD